MEKIDSTKGYAGEADVLLRRYEAIDFFTAHQSVIHLVPDAPSNILDIGSGSGRDAGAFAKMGHSVIAVEPTKALRAPAMALHPSPAIQWVDDRLPELATLQSQGDSFDLIWLSAVWMHLDEAQRQCAMKSVSRLVRKGGAVMMSLRHGPIPPGRRMFEVPDGEMMELAQAQNLQTIVHIREDSLQEDNRLAGVSWTKFVFRKGQCMS